MRKLLKQIIGERISRGRQVLASTGFIFGLTIALLSAQLYTPLKSLLAPRSDYHEYVVLSKQVRMSDALFPSRGEFTEAELNELDERAFVRRWAPLIASQYKVKATVGGQLDFSTEMFLESVPGEFLDIQPANWNWAEDSEYLPLILSHDFLNLYNFGYAISTGLPKLSPSAARLIPIEIIVSGPGGRLQLPARIVGFSHRIQSVLVPLSFMQQANQEIAEVEEPRPSKILVHVEPRSQSQFREFAEHHRLQVNQDQLNRGEVITALNVATAVTLGLGLLFVTLAVTIMILNFAVLLTSARDDLRLLYQLGYTPRLLSSSLTGRLWMSSLVNATIAVILFVVCWSMISQTLHSQGLHLNTSIQPSTVLVGITFVLVTAGVSLGILRQMIQALCR